MSKRKVRLKIIEPKPETETVTTSIPKHQIDILIQKYIESLNEIDKQGYLIAKNHLESSFDIEKSIGFIKFCKNYRFDD